MTAPSMSSDPARPRGDGPREALKDSERRASEEQPGSFKETETEEKIVSIPPVGKDQKPIRGLDPA